MEFEPAELRQIREEFEAAKRRTLVEHPIPVPTMRKDSTDQQALEALNKVRSERREAEEAIARVTTTFRNITSEEQPQ